MKEKKHIFARYNAKFITPNNTLINLTLITMNFKRLLLFLVAPLAMVMGSCTPTEEPEYTTPQITITDEAGAEVTAINFDAEGGDKTITIKATRSWEITKSATWFNATPASDTNLNLQEKSVEVKFTAMPNDEAARTETIKIVMDKIEKSIVVSQADAEGNVAGPQGEGTLESPYNVGRAMEIILAGTYTEDMVYTKGIISELGEDGRAQYGNYTFSISDDGTTTGQLLVYRCKYLNGKNFTTSDNLAIGDEVIVCGQLVNFKGNTPEIQSCYIASLNGFMPEPPALKEGVYASDAAFVCNIDNSNDAVYSLGDTNVGGNDVSGFKLGTGSKAGVFTSAAIGVSGDKYLNFYAVAWNGKSATLYYRVQGGETMSQAVVANTGANNNAPYNGLVIAESDHFSVKLTGLQATDKIEFSTDASFTAAANDKSGRALVFGIKLTDEALGGEAGGNEGGETPEPPVVDGEFIYFDNFDKVAAVQVDKYWPDMSAEYGNPMPATQSAVTYNSNNATARNNSNSNGSYSDYAGSGVNNVFFGKNPTYLTIGGISLAELEGNALTITFGTERYVKDADNTVKNEEFQVYISGDGEKWSPVTYTYSGTPGRWNVATAQLSLKEVPATLSIHFAASVESAYRLDDLKIVAGGEGAEIDLSQGVALDGIGGGEGGEGGEEPEPKPEPNTVTLDEITENGTYNIAGATVVAVEFKNMVVKGTQKMFNVKNLANASANYNVGDVLNLTNATVKEAYGVTVIDGEATNLAIEKTGTATVEHGEATAIDAAWVTNFTESLVPEYVTVSGVGAASGSAYSLNIAVEGSDINMSISLPTAEEVTALVGKTITAKGYAFDYNSKNKYVSIMKVELTVAEGGETPEPEDPELAGTGEGTVDSPYDVVRAKAAIDKFSTVSGVFVKGIVTTHATKYNSTYKSCDYYISVDGTTENELMVYSGKFLNGEDFTSGDQIHAGDEVVVCGNLKIYNGTYEFDKTSKIVSLVCNHETEEPEEPELPIEPGTGIELPWIETFDGDDLSKYTIVSGGSETKVYPDDQLAGGEAGEILISKGNGSMTAVIASDGAAKTLNFWFKTNKPDYISVSSSTNGVTFTKITNTSYTVTVAEGVNSFAITLTNTNSSNARVDDIVLTADAPEVKSIKIAGASVLLAEGGTFECGENFTVTAVYANGTEKDVTADATVDSSAVNMAVAGMYAVTVSYNGLTASYDVTVQNASVQTVTTSIVFKELGYNNGDEVPSVTKDDIAITFALGSNTNNNTAKYYDTGTGVRTYVGNTITVSCEYNMVAIEFTYAGSSYNKISADGYSGTTWSGNAKEVVFNSTGTTRIQAITITYTK